MSSPSVYPQPFGTPPPGTPADWLVDPEDPRRLRFFDGQRWTDNVTWSPFALPPQLFAASLFDPANLERDTEGRVTVQSPSAVKLTLGDPAWVDRAAVTATQGSVAFAPDAASRLHRCEGSGEVFLQARAAQLHHLQLDGTVELCVAARSTVVVDQADAPELVRTSAGDTAMAWYRLRGASSVVVVARDPLVLDTGEATTHVAPSALVAWDAGVEPSFSGGTGMLEVPPGAFVVTSAF